jgi:hypothetical protein
MVSNLNTKLDILVNNIYNKKINPVYFRPYMHITSTTSVLIMESWVK